jgi:hypothetical protein
MLTRMVAFTPIATYFILYTLPINPLSEQIIVHQLVFGPSPKWLVMAVLSQIVGFLQFKSYSLPLYFGS